MMSHELSVAEWEVRLEAHRKRIAKENDQAMRRRFSKGLTKKRMKAIKNNTTMEKYLG